MNIDGMSDQKKSVMLARLCGWSIVEFMQYHDYRLMDASDNEIKSLPDWYQTDGDMLDFYDPDNMDLAKKAIEWGIENKPTYKKVVETNALAAWAKPAGVRVLLDELALYALAIKAGMVTE